MPFPGIYLRQACCFRSREKPRKADGGGTGGRLARPLRAHSLHFLGQRRRGSKGGAMRTRFILPVLLSIGCSEQSTRDLRQSGHEQALSSAFSLACSYMSAVGCQDTIASSPFTYAGGTPGSKGKWTDGGGACNNDAQFGTSSDHHEYGLVNAPPSGQIEPGSSDDLEGIVSGGFPDDPLAFHCIAGGCKHSHLTHTDNTCGHHDRDFNLDFRRTPKSSRTAA